jgi:hypothetical protein
LSEPTRLGVPAWWSAINLDGGGTCTISYHWALAAEIVRSRLYSTDFASLS